MITNVSGIEKIMPPIPQIAPQKNRLMSIIKGESLSLSPVNFGSIMFPKIICMDIRRKASAKNLSPNPMTMNSMKRAIATAIIDPIAGMKLNANIIMEKRRKLSTPNNTITIRLIRAVLRLIMVFVPRYFFIPFSMSRIVFMKFFSSLLFMFSIVRLIQIFMDGIRNIMNMIVRKSS